MTSAGQRATRARKRPRSKVSAYELLHEFLQARDPLKVAEELATVVW